MDEGLEGNRLVWPIAHISLGVSAVSVGELLRQESERASELEREQARAKARARKIGEGERLSE